MDMLINEEGELSSISNVSLPHHAVCDMLYFGSQKADVYHV